MSDQGPDDPTQAVPAPGQGEPPPTGSSSVFDDPQGGGAPGPDEAPTTAVPATPPPAGPGDGAPGGPGGPGGPGDGDGTDGEFDDFDDDRAWYEKPATLVTAGIIGIASIIIILLLAFGGGDGDDDTDTTTTTSTTTTSTTTTAPETTESRCRAGDQEACDEFSDSQLEALCDEGVTAACQVLLSREGDGEVPPTTVAPAPSDTELCRDGDAGACTRLSDSQIEQLCNQGSQAACDEQDRRFAQTPEGRCLQGDAAACEGLDPAVLEDLCNQGSQAACDALDDAQDG